MSDGVQQQQRETESSIRFRISSKRPASSATASGPDAMAVEPAVPAGNSVPTEGEREKRARVVAELLTNDEPQQQVDIEDLPPTMVQDGINKELASLREMGVFDEIGDEQARTLLESGARVLTTRWVHRQRGEGVKSRLVCRDYNWGMGRKIAIFMQPLQHFHLFGLC